MELTYLRTFLEVSESGSYTAAAAALGYAQSSVTAQIQKLEEAYGAVLLERRGRRMALTEAGATLVDYARQIVSLHAESRAAVNSGGTGNLAIGTIETIASYYLPRRLGSFSAAYPDMNVALMAANEPQIIKMVQDGTLDAGFILDPPYADPDLHVRLLQRQDLLIVASAEHAFRGRELLSTCLQAAGWIWLHQIVKGSAADRFLHGANFTCGRWGLRCCREWPWRKRSAAASSMRRGGGGAVFMAEYATKDKKDNYKLFVNSPPILINNLKKEGNSPYGYENTTPLAQLTKDYGAIAVSADSKYNDLKTLLDDMKKDPKAFTVAGGSAPGSMDHLVSILPAYKYGIDPKSIKYVSYDGGGEALTALLGGNADVLGTDASSLDQYLKAGKIKVLAVAAPQRLEGGLKDIPTMKEQGVDAEFLIWRGIFGPKEMSEDAKTFWNDALTKMKDTPEWTAEMKANNWQTDYKNAADFKTFLEEQNKQLKEMLTALGMQK